MARPIHEIAHEILDDHRKSGKRLYFGAAPYVDVMRHLDSITDSFGEDSAREILIYARSNLANWRGETARRVKAEIDALILIKR